MAIIKLSTERITSMEVDQNNLYVASGKKIYVCNKADFQCHQVIDVREKGVQLTIDSNHIYCTGSYHFYVYDKFSYQLLYKCRYGQDISSDLRRPINDKKYVYFPIRNGALVVVCKNDFNNARILRKHNGTIWGMDDDEQFLYTGSVDKTVMVWEKDSFKVVKVLQGHKKNVQRVRVSNQYIISAATDLSILVWDKTSRELVVRLSKAHKRAINGLVFWQSYLLTSSQAERKAIVWQVETWQKVKELELAIDEGGGVVIDNNTAYLALKDQCLIQTCQVAELFTSQH